MSKTRKILSVVLALAMILSTFAVSAFAAASYEDADNEYNQTWALSEPVDNGDDTYTVDVSLTTDYKTGVIQFVLTNTDIAAVEYTSIELGDAIPEDYNADISAMASAKDPSALNVMIIPSTVGVSTIEATEIDGVIAKVTYTLVSGSADITLKDDAASSENPGGTLIAARVSDGNIVTGDMITGQNATIDVATVTIGDSALPSDLALTAAGSTDGVVIDTKKTFGGEYDGVVYGFKQSANNTFTNTTYLTTNLTATNEGSLSFSRSIGASGYGTGTVITVTGKDGGVKKYVVVIFGDVDGNGLIAVADATVIRKAMTDATAAPNNSVKRLAANCALLAAAVPMHNIQANDITPVRNNIKGARIDQAALAAKHATLNTYYQ